MINVGIVFGGSSVEHDVSIITYLQVVKALDIKKYRLYPIYLSRDNTFLVLKNKKNFDNLKVFSEFNRKDFKEVNLIKKHGKVFLGRNILELVINLTHGRGLEDGTLSGYFKILGLPQTSLSVGQSALFHNKYFCKMYLENVGISVVDYIYISEKEWINNEDGVMSLLKRFKKLIIKPCSLGSSVGVKVSSLNEVIKDINSSFLFDKEIIVEKCLDNYLELNQAFYEYKDSVIISKIEEVKNNSSVYSFENKYEDGNAVRVCPAKIPNNLKNKINKITKRIGRFVNSAGIVRIDYLYDNNEDKLYVNEINVIPGSLGYYLFEAKGIYFSKLLDDLISETMLIKGLDDKKINSFKSSILSSKKNCKMNKKN